MTSLLSMTMTISAGWRPFLEPLPLDDYWLWLMLPLIVAICIVYKALKLKNLADLPRHVTYLALQFAVMMAAAAAVLWLLTELA